MITQFLLPKLYKLPGRQLQKRGLDDMRKTFA